MEICSHRGLHVCRDPPTPWQGGLMPWHRGTSWNIHWNFPNRRTKARDGLEPKPWCPMWASWGHCRSTRRTKLWQDDRNQSNGFTCLLQLLVSLLSGDLIEAIQDDMKGAQAGCPRAILVIVNNLLVFLKLIMLICIILYHAFRSSESKSCWTRRKTCCSVSRPTFVLRNWIGFLLESGSGLVHINAHKIYTIIYIYLYYNIYI